MQINLLAVLTLLLFLSCAAWLVQAQTGTQCTPIVGQPGCVCRHPDGVIDLTKIANKNGTPSFTDLKDPNDWLFSFNPCYTYSQEQCQDVYICQSKDGTTDQYDIATGNEGIYIDPQDPRGSVYLYYTGPQSRIAHVYLHCRQNETGKPRVTTLGDSTRLYYYVFDLYSCYACPGGCNKPITTPAACIHPSLPTDSSLLLALAIFGGGSAVIAIVLLIMVMVFTHKLGKKSQYHSKLKMMASQSQ